ncbi:MAG: hypothetical protein M3277_07975 [Actinomycetota bacterium]|nr:hypothetical protein [Actinomycetota bacterium]
MPEVTVRIALAVLATVFAWAAIAKVVGWRRWTDALARYELPVPIERVARVGVPGAEVVVAGLILSGRSLEGVLVALVLLGIFSAVVMQLRAGREAVPCGCFGSTRERSASTMLLRNLVLSALAAVVVVSDERPTLLQGIAAPGAGDAVPAALIVLGLALASWLLRHTFFGRPAP